MKNIKYIIYSFIAAVILVGCGDSGIDTRMDSDDFFVAFDTKNQVFTSTSITEGDTAIISVVVGATKGASITVNFDVEAPKVTDPQSAAYKLLSMDNKEMTANTLTFPEGTGYQKFKFVVFDNDIVDGKRTFVLSLRDNSAGYTIGVGTHGEASTFKINVLDDEVWQSIGTGTFVDSWALGDFTYSVEIKKMIGEERYRVMKPYAEGFFHDDGEWGNWIANANGPEYIEFWEIGGGLIRFESFAMGLIYQGIPAQPIGCYYPADLDASIDVSYNKKISNKVYQFAPYYYVSGVGGWNKTESNGVVLIQLP